MAHSLTGVSSSLSKNVLELRRSRNLSQSALAKLSQVPRSTITHLESGNGNPSLSNLLKVAQALQISIEELIRQPKPRNKILKKDQIPKLIKGQGLATVYKLLPDAVPAMELDRLELRPGARMGGVPHTAQTREYLVCIRGQIDVVLRGEKHRLAEGDVLAFDGDQPHAYLNTGKTISEGVSVVVLG